MRLCFVVDSPYAGGAERYISFLAHGLDRDIFDPVILATEGRGLDEWCGELVLKEITERTGGLCTGCFRTHLGEQLTEVEVRARGQRVKARMTGNRRAKNKGNPKTAKLAEKARMKALKRLRAVFPDLYDVFVAEERARLGLDPWSIDAVVRENGGPSADETISFARTYHALDSHGVDIDGLA